MYIGMCVCIYVCICLCICLCICVQTALLDTFLCFQDNLETVENYLLEAHRVLKDEGGTLLVVSHGLPDTRLEHFPGDMWTVEVVEMGE
jgi:hypothetical protein